MILKKTIDKIVYNALHDPIYHNALYVTGPGILGDTYFEETQNKSHDFDIFFTGFTDNRYTIQQNNKIILQSYKGYQEERSNINDEKSSYLDLFRDNDIFNF